MCIRDREHLGQSGLKINNANKCILIDPYLSNSVQELDSFDLKREVPILYKPEELTNVEYILFTHEHIDHCDPHTVPIIAANNPKSSATRYGKPDSTMSMTLRMVGRSPNSPCAKLSTRLDR